MTANRKALDPKLDIVFWLLFAGERNRALLLSLLNAVLRPAVPIEVITLLHAEPEKLTADDKGIALDVRVKLASGEQVDIEMQSQRRPALLERVLYYWARLYAGQLTRGADYPALRRCAVILFADFNLLQGPRFHSIFRALEVHSAQPLTDHLELHVVELTKLASSVDRNDEPNLALWAKFLTAATDEELQELAMQHPVLKEAKEALDELSADPDARLRAEQREMALLSYQLDLGKMWHDGIAEGEAKGEAKGEARGRASALIAVLEARNLHPTAEQRERLEGCRDYALLERWLLRAVKANSASEVFDG